MDYVVGGLCRGFILALFSERNSCHECVAMRSHLHTLSTYVKFAITVERQLISRWMHWLRQITSCQTQESRIPRQYGLPFGIYPAENTYAFRLRKRVLSAISRFFGEDITASALPHCRLAARGKCKWLGNVAAGRSCWGQIRPCDWEEIEPLLPGVRSQIALKIFW